VAPDVRLFLWINGLAGKTPVLDSIMKFAVNDYFIPVTLALVALALWFWGGELQDRDRHQRAVLFATVGVAIANLAVSLLNQLDPWPRPFAAGHAVNLLFYTPHDPSFPSNPAAVGFSMALGVFLGHRRLGVFALLMAGLYSLARVYTGVAYPSDAAAGGVVGALSTYFVARVMLPLLEPAPTLFLKLARRLYLA
jgi:undecaprenyl-diphosphatase